MLFAYGHYYPSGGVNDFVDSFSTIEEVLNYLNETVDYYGELEPKHDYSEAHIYNITLGTRINFINTRGLWQVYEVKD